MLHQLFNIATKSNYAQREDSKKIETRILNASKLSEKAVNFMESQFDLLNRVSFKLDEGVNVYVQRTISKAGEILYFFNVAPVTILDTVPQDETLAVS